MLLRNSLNSYADSYDWRHIDAALKAKFIVSDDISRISANKDDADVPYLIWYPNLFDPETLVALVARKSVMQTPAARACIAAQDLQTFLLVVSEPFYTLMDALYEGGFEDCLDYSHKKPQELDIDTGGRDLPFPFFRLFTV